jgi:hypothetical protein
MGWKAAAAESAASFDPSLNEQKASKSQNSGNLVTLEMLEIEVLDESHLITLAWATYTKSMVRKSRSRRKIQTKRVVYHMGWQLRSTLSHCHGN